MIHRLAKLMLMVGAGLLLVGAAAQALPSNIDPNQAYVWSEAVGWINFHPSHGGVLVQPTHLSGFAWSPNIGWIELGAPGAAVPYANTSATDWGVNRAPDGSLSGFAWSETAGWINFKTTHGQVTLPVQPPMFQGFAWAGNLGFIHFSNPVAGYGLALLARLDIPTLSQWGLILLVLLLGAAAFRQMRRAPLSM